MEENKRQNRRDRKNAKKQAKQNKVFVKIRRYVQDKYNKKVEDKEKKLGRSLTREEKNKIVDSLINGMGVQLTASSATVLSAFTVGSKLTAVKALPAPAPAEPETMLTQEKTETKIETEAKTVETEGTEVVVDTEEKVEEVEIPKKTVVPITNIDEINNKDDMLNWLQNVYMNKYKEKNIQGYQKAITTENFEEMKDIISVLAGIKDVTQKAFELVDLYGQLEEKPGNEFIENIIKSGKQNLKTKYQEVFGKEEKKENKEQDKTA